jgi:polyhydroxyalkanoic acid synthase PhaR subunit
MTKGETRGGDTDPFETWRQLYDANERAWTSALEQAMGSPQFSETSGKMLETMLAAQKSVRDNMRTYLETMNVPTREDIARLGELVVGLEEKIDQLGDRLDAIEEAVRVNVAASISPAASAGSARADVKRTKPARRAASPETAR